MSATAVVNFATPEDLIAAEAAAAVSAPPSPTNAERAILNSVAAATNLTKALTDSMSQTLSDPGYSPGSGGDHLKYLMQMMAQDLKVICKWCPSQRLNRDSPVLFCTASCLH